MNSRLAERMRRAWEVAWSRFYIPKTNLFYDYLSSYEPGRELAHLPTAAEAARQYPNHCGYGTGMEDCMISAGVLMDMILDRHAVTGEASLRADTRAVFLGIQRCATAHGVPGFLARGVCPEDGTSIYITSSRDQYTHAVHGLWRYYHSPLCDEDARAAIREILGQFADRMTRNVTPANNYCFLRADGTPDPRGICRMLQVKGHEAARLPMIYAAAWDVGGNAEHYRLYRKHLAPAVAQSLDVESVTPTYCLPQMQCSLELLAALETDADLKAQMRQAMWLVAQRAAPRAVSAGEAAGRLDLMMLGRDWRQTEELSGLRGEYRKVWYCPRESGEAALSQFMAPELPFPEGQRALLVQAITRVDYERVSSSGIFYLLGAYWKACRLGVFAPSD